MKSNQEKIRKLQETDPYHQFAMYSTETAAIIFTVYEFLIFIAIFLHNYTLHLYLFGLYIYIYWILGSIITIFIS